MKGDFTRFSNDSVYSGVLLQQGRLLLDSDWNSQQRINAHLRQSQTRDFVGLAGVPRTAGTVGFHHFRLESTLDPANQDLLIAPGHIYVDGIFCELKAPPVVFKCSGSTGPNYTLTVAELGRDGQTWKADQWIEVLSIKQADGKVISPSSPWLGKIFRDPSPTPRGETLLSLEIQSRSDNPDIRLAEGNLGELRLIPTLLNQPFYSRGTLPTGKNLAYLDAWQHHVTAVEDPTLLESALNGPDTTTRTQTIWQIKLTPAPPDIETEDDIVIKQLIQPKPRGLLSAKAHDTGSSGTSDLDNLLYRVEIHQGGPLGTASLKWSRENGSVANNILSIEENKITINNTNLDSERSFEKNQWVEISDNVCDLEGKPGSLVRLTKVMGNILFFDPSTVDGASISPVIYLPVNRPKVRRWDHTSQQSTIGSEIGSEKEGEVYTISQPIDLENGLTVQLHASTEAEFKTGDYWLIPFRRTARISADRIEWPYQEIEGKRVPVPQPPQGIDHHYAPLAIVTVTAGSSLEVVDKRKTFPSLIDCLEQSDLSKPEELEVTGALYVTGRETGSPYGYVPARIGVGADKSPKASVDIQSAKVKARGQLSGDKSQIRAINLPPRETLEALQAGDVIEVEGVAVVIQKVEDNTLTIEPLINGSDLSGVSAGEINFTYQYPLLRLRDESGTTQVIANARGQIGVGTTALPIETTLGVVGQTAIGESNFIARVGNFSEIPAHPDTHLRVQKTLQTGTLAVAQQDSGSVVGLIQPQGDQVVFQVVEDNKSFGFLKGDVSVGADGNPQDLTVYGSTFIQNGLSLGSLENPAPSQGLRVEGKVGIGTDTPPSGTVFGVNGQTVIGEPAFIARTGSFSGIPEDAEIHLRVQKTIQTGALAIAQPQPVGNNFVVVGTIQPVDNQIAFKAEDPAKTFAFLQGDVSIGTKDTPQGLTVYGATTLHDSLSVGSAGSAAELRIYGKVGIGTATPPEETVLGVGGLVAIGEASFVSKNDGFEAISPLDDTNLWVQKTLQAGAFAITQQDESGFSVVGRIQPGVSQVVFQTENDNNFTFLGGNVSIGSSQETKERQLDVYGTVFLRQSVSIGSEEVAPSKGVYVTGGVCVKKISEEGEEKYALQINPDAEEQFILKINGKTIKQVVEGNSSRTLKKEIEPLATEDAKGLLQNLVPVQFKFKDDPTEKLRIGFIAEDVPEIFATADRKAINPNDIIATLTKVIKAQQEDLARLTEVVKIQQKDITALKQIVHEHRE